MSDRAAGQRGGARLDAGRGHRQRRRHRAHAGHGDDSYERGAPVDFPLGRIVPGVQKAIVGQKVGSTVAVAVTSADGYPNGQAGAGIRPGDTLVFAIKILSATG